MKRTHNLYRVSTMKQVDINKDDIPMQRIACNRFAEEQGWVVTKEYEEKGVSGFKVSANERDAIQELKDAALRGNFEVLCVPRMAHNLAVKVRYGGWQLPTISQAQGCPP